MLENFVNIFFLTLHLHVSICYDENAYFTIGDSDEQRLNDFFQKYDVHSLINSEILDEAHLSFPS